MDAVAEAEDLEVGLGALLGVPPCTNCGVQQEGHCRWGQILDIPRMRCRVTYLASLLSAQDLAEWAQARVAPRGRDCTDT